MDPCSEYIEDYVLSCQIENIMQCPNSFFNGP